MMSSLSGWWRRRNRGYDRLPSPKSCRFPTREHISTPSFMATVLQPVFFTSNAARKIDVDFDRVETGNAQVTLSKVIKDYLFVPPYKGWALPGQPRKQVSYQNHPVMVKGVLIWLAILSLPDL